MDNTFKRFNFDEIEEAKSVNIVDYLLTNGYNLKKAGKQYLLEPHSSFVIFPQTNSWFYYKENIGGNIINFLQEYESKSFKEAVSELLGKSISTERKYTKYVSVPMEKGEIILPKKSNNTNKVFDYLTKNRGIDSDIILELLKNGDIYQTEDYGSVVFVSKDKENHIKYACIRSTYENSSFKQDVENSNKNYGFKTIGKSDKVFVFEAPIDLLSHATISKMQGKDWQEDNRISLGCVSDNALEKFLEENTHIKEVVLFLDNDETGLKNAEKITQKYGNDYDIKIFTSVKGKDLNETLVTYQNEKKLNKNLKINNFIKEIEKPFIPPKFNKNKEIDILNKLNENIKDINFKDLLKNNNFEIKETTDNKVVFLSKENDRFKVIKCGFEFDISNLNFKSNLLSGSKENYLFLGEVDNNFQDKPLVFTDNMLSYCFHEIEYKDFNMILTDNLTLENIKEIKSNFPKVDTVFVLNSSKETLNNFKDIEKIKEDLNIKNFSNEDTFIDFEKSFLKKQTPKKLPLSEKISIKKRETNQINTLNQNKQEKPILENNKKFSNMSI